jgi:MFS family permease
MAAQAPLDRPAADGFLPRFVSLAVMAGATIGMGNVITTLFALHLGADSLEVGLISGAATLGMMAVTLPAGFLIARYGARRVYLLASLNCAAIYLIVPWLTLWPALAVARGLVGASVPFRTISMNSTFLERVQALGLAKAGWYRAAQSTGMAVIGPWLGTLLIGSASFLVSYTCLAAMFLAMAAWSQNFLPDAEASALTTEAQAVGFLGEIRAMLGDPWVGESCLTEFVNSSTTSLFSSFIIVLAVRNLGWATEQAVLLVTTQGLTLIAALFLLGPLLRAAPLSVAYGASLGLATAALLLIGLGSTLPVLMLGAVALAAGAALIHLVNVRRLADSLLPKSKISSLLNFAGQAGSLVGSVAGGLLSVVIGLHHVFLAWLPLIWAVALFCLWRFHSTRRREIAK